MLYAVMSDAHANPGALAAAIDDARGRGCGRFVLLGDTTGYGYDVKGTLRLVRENFDIVLMGNHDSACAGLEPVMETMNNRNYREDVRQREQLTDGELDWLRSRPYLHVEDGMAFVHGDFTNPATWNYVFSTQSAATNLMSRPERVLFCGHTHHAAAWEMQDGGVVRPRLLKYLSHPAVRAGMRSFSLKEDSRCIVNAGSVGHPRADRCITYVIYNPDAHRVTFRRLPVDLAAYGDALEKNGIGQPIWLYDAINSTSSAASKGI